MDFGNIAVTDLGAVGALTFVAIALVRLQAGRLARIERILLQIREAVGGKPKDDDEA